MHTAIFSLYYWSFFFASDILIWRPLNVQVIFFIFCKCWVELLIKYLILYIFTVLLMGNNKFIFSSTLITLSKLYLTFAGQKLWQRQSSTWWVTPSRLPSLHVNEVLRCITTSCSHLLSLLLEGKLHSVISIEYPQIIPESIDIK